MTSTPCSVCSKKVFEWNKAILCDLCQNWVHYKCNKLDNLDYHYHSQNPTAPFTCLSCTDNCIPFTKLNDNQFTIVVNKGINYADEVELNLKPNSRDKRLMDRLKDVSRQLKGKNNDDLSTNINCSYYSTDEFANLKLNPIKNFSIIHLNIHSIELHIEELRLTLELLNFHFDIICISESKIQKDIEPKVDINIDGYQQPLNTPSEAKKGGVLMYVKNGISFKPRPDLSLYKPKELESVFIETLNPNSKNSIIGTIYRHPRMDAKIFNEEYLRSLLMKLDKENKDKYITGDFNFDLLKTSNHTDSFDFLDMMMTYMLLPSITLPTRINPINNTLIDNIFTSDIHPELISGNLSVAISDHLPSFLVIPKQNQNFLPKKHNIWKRDRSKYNKNDFVLDFLSVDWDKDLELGEENVNHSLDIFLTKMINLLDKHMPLRKISQKEFKRQFKPWISDEILHMIGEKNKLFKKYVKCKDSVLKNTYNNEYKGIKNVINHSLKNNKKAYYNDYFTRYKQDLQKVWSGIKNIINIKNKNLDYPTCITHNDELVTNPTDISNKFNDFYVSIADNILNNRRYGGKALFTDFLDNPMPNSMALYPCDDAEVASIIRQLDSKKASGPNSIPPDILHLLQHDISKPLTKIYNLSFKTGVHPDAFKVAKVVPLYKKGSKLLVSNYRPISLLSNLNKILEKLMYKRVYDYLERNKILYKLQFGFRSKHSTKLTLIDITENIRKALDSKKFAASIFVDLQKAFDTVNHEILIKKLSHYGIRGIINKWFLSYLMNRSQYVSILGFDSTYRESKHGVPQGSVLGPLLFLLYINDFHKAIKYSQVYHFADDTNLLKISNSPKQLQKHLNIDLKFLYKWLLANKISLNCSKTEFIIFKKPHDYIDFNFRLKLNGHLLQTSDSIKYLGLYLDSELNWKTQCDVLSKKLKRANGMLMKIRHYIDKKELRSVYFALFASHLSYGSQIWGQAKTANTSRISKLQNRALRIIDFANFQDDVNPIYKASKTLKLEDHIKIQNCLFVFDYLSGRLPHCFDGYFTRISEVHSIQTVSSQLGCLYIPHFSTTRYGLNSIVRKCAKTWNFFSKHLKNDLSVYKRGQLKSILEKFYISSY